MRTVAPIGLIALCIACIGLTEAFTDFHALNPDARVVEGADGRITTSHDVHHTFEETGTFFKAKHTAVHHKKWHFVGLHEHVEDMETQVRCGEDAMHVRQPSSSLVDALGKQQFEHTVMHAHSKFHCDGDHILRRVTGMHMNSENELEVHTMPVLYQDIFEHLDVEIETNHIEHDGGEEEFGGDHDLSELDEPSLGLTTGEENPAEEHRAMQLQRRCGRICRAIRRAKSAAQALIEKAKKAAAAAAARAREIARKAAAALKAIGNFEKTKYAKFKLINYNGDVSSRFSKWYLTGNAKLAASVNAAVTLYAKLRVASFSLQEVTAYVYGSIKAGVRTSFNSQLTTNQQASRTLWSTNISPISWDLGVVTVTIRPSMQVYGGYQLDIEGRTNVNLMMSAGGSLRIGQQYTKSRGWQPVNSKSFGYTRDFSPRTYRYNVGTSAYVQAKFSLKIDNVGSAQGSVTINTEAMLQQNRACSTAVNMNVQPVVTAGAQMNIQIKGRSLYKRTWPSKSLYSAKTSIFSFCIPNRTSVRTGWSTIKSRIAAAVSRVRSAAASRGSERAMAIQDANVEGQDIETFGVPSTDANFAGTNWEGQDSCNMNFGGQYNWTQVSASAQFMPGDYEDESQLILTIAQNVSDGQGAFNLLNQQQTYYIYDEVKTGLNSAIYRNATDVTYNASNTGITPQIDNSINLYIPGTSIDSIELSAPNLCGRMTFATTSMNNDNSTFTIFSSGESEPSLIEKLKAYAIYAPVLGVVVLVAVLAAVVVSRKRAAAAKGATWAKVDGTENVQFHHGAGLQDEQPVRAAGNVDDRVDAL